MPQQLVPLAAARVIHKIKRSSMRRFRLFPCVLMATTFTSLALLTMAIIVWSGGWRFDLMEPRKEELILLETSSTSSISPELAQLLQADPEEEVRDFDTSLGELDRSQRYVKHPFVVMATEWKDLAQAPVGLATHASLDHLHHLVDTVSMWTGPISVAVFTPDIEYQLARIYIRYLRACFPEMRRKVSFHFVHPVARPARSEGGPMDQPIAGCDGAPRAVLEGLLARRPADMAKAWRNVLPYPQNLMRNLARFTCPGKYLLCPDVDMVVTVQDLDQELAEFLERPETKQCQRCAYVVPVYEVRPDQSPPANKTALLELVKKKTAHAFHVKVFRPNQGLSNLPFWEKKGEGPALNVSHSVGKFAFFYEPVYVASREVPPFDERFVGFGHTRNTQAYEMFVAGWQFSVLNNVFLVHWGFQYLKSRPPWRLKQAAVNARRFPGFVRELAIRYDRDPLGMLDKPSRRKYNIAVQNKVKSSSQPPAAAKAQPARSVPAYPAPPAHVEAPVVPAVSQVVAEDKALVSVVEFVEDPDSVQMR